MSALFFGDELADNTGQHIDGERRHNEFLPGVEDGAACRHGVEFVVGRLYRARELALLDIAAAQTGRVRRHCVVEQSVQYAPRRGLRERVGGEARSERGKYGMEFFAGDDLPEGITPIERALPARSCPCLRSCLRPCCRSRPYRCDGFKRRERNVEVELVVEIIGRRHDLAQPRYGLAMPGTGPPEWVIYRDVARVARTRSVASRRRRLSLASAALPCAGSFSRQ